MAEMWISMSPVQMRTILVRVGEIGHPGGGDFVAGGGAFPGELRAFEAVGPGLVTRAVQVVEAVGEQVARDFGRV